MVLRRVASAISKVFHPIFSPLMAFVIIAISVNASAIYSYHQLMLIFLTIGLLTVVFPSLVVLFLKWMGLISHYELSRRSERILPLIVGAIFVWGCSSFLFKIHFPISLTIFFRLAVILILLATFITLFWKISLHALGWGILTAITLIVFGLRPSDYFFLFPIFLFISGVVSTARLYMGVHSPAQIYSGYALGFIGMFLGLVYQVAILTYLI